MKNYLIFLYLFNHEWVTEWTNKKRMCKWKNLNISKPTYHGHGKKDK